MDRMTQHVTAIYEHGVLKPLAPLDLREQEVVSVSIENIPLVTIQEGNNPLGKEESAYDALVRMNLLGSLKAGPNDLSTNPEHMEGFGGSDR